MKKVDSVGALSISPDGTYVAVATDPFTAKRNSGGSRIWRSKDGKSWKQAKIPGLKGIGKTVAGPVWTPAGFIVLIVDTLGTGEQAVWR